MSKDEYYFINEQRISYMELLMDKYPGQAARSKRQSYYDKLNEWRDQADKNYRAKQAAAPLVEKSWELRRV